jgi:hypothetical protein
MFVPIIDFTKEPYKNMIDPKDPEKSKKIIQVIVSLIGPPDENGKFKFTKDQLIQLNQHFFYNPN